MFYLASDVDAENKRLRELFASCREKIVENGGDSTWWYLEQFRPLKDALEGLSSPERTNGD